MLVLDLDPELETALRSLSMEDREMLLLIAWEELTPREVGQNMGISPVALRVRLHRASAGAAAAALLLGRLASTSRIELRRGVLAVALRASRAERGAGSRGCEWRATSKAGLATRGPTCGWCHVRATLERDFGACGSGEVGVFLSTA
jgi:predicted DNA-binding protein (UPF0251 family)